MSDDDDKVVPIRPEPPGGHKRKRPGRGDPAAKGQGPASGTPAGGPGWGGEAKGAAENRKPKNEGGPPGGYERNPDKLSNDPEDMAQEALMAMVTIMRTSPYEATKLAAAEKVLNRIKGTPVAQVIVDDQQQVDRPLSLVAVWPDQASNE